MYRILFSYTHILSCSLYSLKRRIETIRNGRRMFPPNCHGLHSFPPLAWNSLDCPCHEEMPKRGVTLMWSAWSKLTIRVLHKEQVRERDCGVVNVLLPIRLSFIILYNDKYRH